MSLAQASPCRTMCSSRHHATTTTWYFQPKRRLSSSSPAKSTPCLIRNDSYRSKNKYPKCRPPKQYVYLLPSGCVQKVLCSYSKSVSDCINSTKFLLCPSWLSPFSTRWSVMIILSPFLLAQPRVPAISMITCRVEFGRLLLEIEAVCLGPWRDGSMHVIDMLRGSARCYNPGEKSLGHLRAGSMEGLKKSRLVSSRRPLLFSVVHLHVLSMCILVADKTPFPEWQY